MLKTQRRWLHGLVLVTAALIAGAVPAQDDDAFLDVMDLAEELTEKRDFKGAIKAYKKQRRNVGSTHDQLYICVLWQPC